jgi:hypothetical protein
LPDALTDREFERHHLFFNRLKLIRREALEHALQSFLGSDGAVKVAEHDAGDGIIFFLPVYSVIFR